MKKYLIIILCQLFFINIVAADEVPLHQESLKLSIDVISDADSKANSFVLSDGVGAMIVNTLPNQEALNKITTLLKPLGITVEKILITNNNPEHASNLKIYKEKFPKAQVIMYSDNINKNDNIEMPGGGILEVIKSEKTSAPQETALYSADLNALLASDLAFNKVHPKLEGISADNIQTWIQALKHLQSKYGNENLRVYPGHGNPGTVTLLETNIKYLQDFLETIQSSFSEAEALSTLQRLYPDYQNPNQNLEKGIKYHIQAQKKTITH
jgi:glyoxylase-like metal-dependent hydrolase (beta-lactamase superfamily II)